MYTPIHTNTYRYMHILGIQSQMVKIHAIQAGIASPYLMYMHACMFYLYVSACIWMYVYVCACMHIFIALGLRCQTSPRREARLVLNEHSKMHLTWTWSGHFEETFCFTAGTRHRNAVNLICFLSSTRWFQSHICHFLHILPDKLQVCALIIQIPGFSVMLIRLSNCFRFWIVL
jgi:hypothetical protein